jgi:hypothetical protein
MSVQPWFPHPIYFLQLEGAELASVQAEMQDIYDQQLSGMSKNPNWERDTHHLTDPDFNCNILRQYPCPTFNRVVTQALQDYLQTVGVEPEWAQDYNIINSWATCNRQHEYARLHDHGTVDIAGVYYLKTTGEDGNFYFKSPNSLLAHSYAFQKIPDEQDIRPIQGQMMLWPGFLYHGTRVNQTEHDRISISFNIQIKRWYQDHLFPQKNA